MKRDTEQAAKAEGWRRQFELMTAATPKQARRMDAAYRAWQHGKELPHSLEAASWQ